MPIEGDLIRTVTANLYEWALKKVLDDTKAALKRAHHSESHALGRSTLIMM